MVNQKNKFHKNGKYNRNDNYYKCSELKGELITILKELIEGK